MTLALLLKKLHHLWRVYGTMNNIVVAGALIIAIAWIGGTISVMQTNLTAQKAVDSQQRQLELAKLEVDTLKYQQNYYTSDEYKDLAARRELGLVQQGEKVLILPPNTTVDPKADEGGTAKDLQGDGVADTRSNVVQWLDFFSGKSAHRLQE